MTNQPRGLHAVAAAERVGPRERELGLIDPTEVQPVPPNSLGQGVESDNAGQAQIATVGQVRVAEGEVSPCEAVPAGDGPAPVRGPKGGWDFSDAEYAGWGFGFGLGGAK